MSETDSMPSGAPRTGHETTDANVGGVFVFGAALAVMTAAAMLVAWLVFGYLRGRQAAVAPAYPLAAGHEDRLPPEPRLQTDPPADMQRLLEEENRTLTTYGWVNKDAGIVRIPIDRAMALVVERGLPARPAAGSTPPVPAK
jgi:hypothetical protein